MRGLDHGSQVVLLGRHERHDTIQAPESVTDGRRRWITRYLNGRFLRLSEQVEVLVRDQQGQPRELQRIHGELHHLQQRAIAARAVQLSDGIARWWVLDDDHRVRRREAAIWASTGHAAAVFGDKLYDILPQTRGGYGRLQDFGIASASKASYYTSNRTSKPTVSSATPPGRCCCSTTSRCHGLAGATSWRTPCVAAQPTDRAAPIALRGCLLPRRHCAT